MADDHYAEDENTKDYRHQLSIVSCRMREQSHQSSQQGEDSVDDQRKGYNGIRNHERCGAIEERRPALVGNEHENEWEEYQKKGYEIYFHWLGGWGDMHADLTDYADSINLSICKIRKICVRMVQIYC